MDTKKIYDRNYLIGLEKLTTNSWYTSIIIPIDKIIEPTKKSLFKSLRIIIIIEIFILSNLMTRNEMSSYRLDVIEKMNDKLRMYKHDFNNYLQIVHSLLEMV